MNGVLQNSGNPSRSCPNGEFSHADFIKSKKHHEPTVSEIVSESGKQF